MSNETEAAPAQTETSMPSPNQETASSTVENVPQSDGDFASWLTDRLEKFEKGEETPPWEQKQAEEPAVEAEGENESKDEEPKSTEEASDEPEAAAEEEDEDSKNMSASAGAKFKELKSELKTYKARVSELEKAVEEAKSSTQNSEEFDRLRSQLAEYEQEIAVTRVEATPDFKRAVLEPTQAILDTAAALAGRYKIDTRKLVNALHDESLNEGSDALTELAADFSERDRVRLYRMADDLHDVSRRREYLRQNAAQAYAEQQQRAKTEEARIEQAYKADIKKASEQVWEGAFLQNSTLSKLDKTILDDIRSVGSEADLLDSSAEDRAYAVYAGVALPHMVKQFEAANSKVVELEKALAKYKKATPRASGNADTSVPDTGTGGFLEAIEKRFG
jgi:hypothetical protein